MFGFEDGCLLAELDDKNYSLDDYTSCNAPRWCPACGNHSILTSVQRLCTEEQLPPEKTMFVSGIGCSSRFPHYMKTYGFHGLHGRALPAAQGIRMSRPDLHVFVTMGDGDCCSIGAGHWIHAVRYNMDMVAMLHDNYIYGLTKNQTSPTTPVGHTSNTHPRGALLQPLNPLVTTLSIANVSFVAQTVDWMPSLLLPILKAAFHHKGFGFVRVLQRCPKYTDDIFNDHVSQPERLHLLTHADGLTVDADTAKACPTRSEHEPTDLNRARELASDPDRIPVGVLYRNPEVPCYEDVLRPRRRTTAARREEVLAAEFDRFAIVAGA